MLYDATVDTFTISRKDFTALAGAYAASSFGQYVIGNMLFDSSLVQTATIQPTTGTSSGFVFVDQNGFFISAPDSASPGVIARVNTADGTAVLPTGVVEAPVCSVRQTEEFTRSLVILPERQRDRRDDHVRNHHPAAPIRCPGGRAAHHRCGQRRGPEIPGSAGRADGGAGNESERDQPGHQRSAPAHHDRR